MNMARSSLRPSTASQASPPFCATPAVDVWDQLPSAKALLEAQRAAASIALVECGFPISHPSASDRVHGRRDGRSVAAVDGEGAQRSPREQRRDARGGIALAEHADALADAVPPQDERSSSLSSSRWSCSLLIVDLMKAASTRAARRLVPYLVAVPLLISAAHAATCATTRAGAVYRPVIARAGGALGIPRAWEIEGLRT